MLKAKKNYREAAWLRSWLRIQCSDGCPQTLGTQMVSVSDCRARAEAGVVAYRSMAGSRVTADLPAMPNCMKKELDRVRKVRLLRVLGERVNLSTAAGELTTSQLIQRGQHWLMAASESGSQEARQGRAGLEPESAAGGLLAPAGCD